METTYLQQLAHSADRILKEELEHAGLPPTCAAVRIYDIQTVGVQGDERSYEYPAEIEFFDSVNTTDPSLLETLSNRIPNEVRGINKVLVVTAVRKRE